MTKRAKLMPDSFEYGILINALNEMRNRLLREGCCTEKILTSCYRKPSEEPTK